MKNLITIFFTVGILLLPLRGDVVTDGTLGTAASLTGPEFAITENLGQRSGNGLFHSFQTFNLATGERATFSGSGEIAHIFSRVTGGTVSQIDGTIRSTIPNANLYLINPDGIVFGANAEIDVDGNFSATTAEVVLFQENKTFEQSGNAPLLAIADPVSFGFLKSNPGTITFDGANLTVNSEKNLTIAGGDISIGNNARLTAPNGHIRVAAVSSTGQLPIALWDTSNFNSLANVEIAGGSRASVSGDNAGKITVRGNNLTIKESSAVFNSVTGAGTGGITDIKLSGKLLLDNGTIQNDVGRSATGTAGDMRIQASEIAMLPGGFVSSETFGAGNSGSIFIDTEKFSIDGNANAFTGIFTSTYSSSFPGIGGNIEVNAKESFFNNNVSVESSSFGLGNAGRITLNSDRIEITDQTVISARSASNFEGGNAGDISITAGSMLINNASIKSSTDNQNDSGKIDVTITNGNLNIANGGFIDADTNYLGNGGDIDITIPNGDLVMDGQFSQGQITRISTGSRDPFRVGANGKSGDITITAKNVNLLNEARITSNTNSLGDSGKITLTSDTLTIDGGGNQSTIDTGLLSESININSGSSGKGGDIEITSKAITLLQAGVISATTNNPGAAGNIKINNQGGTLIIDGQNTFATTGIRTSSSATLGNGGDAGRIDINTGELSIFAGATITSLTTGEGLGGLVNVQADSILIDDKGTFLNTGITTEALQDRFNFAQGKKAGDIQLNAQAIRVLNRGEINSQSRSEANGGEINLNTGLLELANSSNITTSASSTGNAGLITVNGNSTITLTENSAISSSANTGFAGNIVIEKADAVALTNSKISVQSNQGDAGKVFINAGKDILLTQSEISAQAGNNGGNLEFNSRFVGMTDSRLTANAVSGNGGVISLNLQFLYSLGNSSITAISQQGSNGIVNVRNTVEFFSSLLPIQEELLSNETSLLNTCALHDPFANSFIMKGKGGVPYQPQNFLPVYFLNP